VELVLGSGGRRVLTVPALFINSSKRPNVFSTSSARVLTCSSLVTSQGKQSVLMAGLMGDI
jgi:hypothetical protein